MRFNDPAEKQRHIDALITNRLCEATIRECARFAHNTLETDVVSGSMILEHFGMEWEFNEDENE